MEVVMEQRIDDVWGARTPFAPGEGWPVRVDQRLDAGIDDADVDRWVRSACVLCSYGCGVDIAVKDDRIVGIRGRADDHVNHGRLGPKGLYGWRANHADDRLRRPLIRSGGRLLPSSWDAAMSTIVERVQQLLAERGPSSVGVYTSGQLFLEDYYTLAVIARAGIGTAHLDGNTRLCTATADAALKESFGADGDPGVLRGRRPLRHALHGRSQRGRDPDRALGTGPGPAQGIRAAASGRRRSAEDVDGP
jgi:anaerobic selenocysteine-containing dehydrogenase